MSVKKHESSSITDSHKTSNTGSSTSRYAYIYTSNAQNAADGLQNAVASAASTDEKTSKRQLSLEDVFFSNKVACNESMQNNCSGKCEYCKLDHGISTRWRHHLKDEFDKQYFAEIKMFLHENKDHLPPVSKIFSFMDYFELEHTKVVIIGQDPYHNVGQAMGLSFSVPIGIPIPPSLRNIYTELAHDIEDFVIPTHGDLSRLAERGVLLLNDVLTVTKNKPNSHADIGWRVFTDRILHLINTHCTNVVFMLWGKHAQAKGRFIDRHRHLVLACGHPSPFSSKMFFGCRHFSKANKYLSSHGKSPINWQV
ncbi:uracil DNA glycosylase [Ordospora pajunii]|uniref:uracil DNA glycosylase n=1 Tax=Ordospora pajunii TaxID=3039483 RepID=UPI0029528846|nr:uracil DNA glycosylase [Ordospora pajunii]KAH9411493.1 uracil DNA glycosylase [Ordospora pajunii]